MNNAKSQPIEKKKSKIYSFARGLITVVFNTILPIWIVGHENLPTSKPYIFIGNHKSWLDPVCMAYGVKKDQITFLAKKELFDTPVLGKILYKVGMIPVDRNHSDMKAIRTCLSVLNNNEILGFFPEGTRYKQGVMEDVEGGIALIGLRSKVPIVPMYIAHPLRFFRKNICYIGKAIPTADLIEQGISNEVSEVLLGRIRENYRMLVQKAQK